MGRWLRLFTDIPLDEVARLEALQDREINEAKKILATAVTALVHGQQAADDAAKTAQTTFEQGQMGANLPTYTLDKATLGTLTLPELLVNTGLAASKGEAKKLIEGGGVRLNDEKVTDPRLVVQSSLLSDGFFKLSKGQKHIVKVVVG